MNTALNLPSSALPLSEDLTTATPAEKIELVLVVSGEPPHDGGPYPSPMARGLRAVLLLCFPGMSRAAQARRIAFIEVSPCLTADADDDARLRERLAQFPRAVVGAFGSPAQVRLARLGLRPGVDFAPVASLTPPAIGPHRSIAIHSWERLSAVVRARRAMHGGSRLSLVPQS